MAGLSCDSDPGDHLDTRRLVRPPRPPGGHIPLYQGGNNRAGYPPLNQTVSVPSSPAGPIATLDVSCSPNPFRSRAQFRFTTRPDERGRLQVFTLNGRLVRSFAVESRRTGLRREITWDGRDQRGRRLAPGMYLYRVGLGARSGQGKILHVR